MAWKTPKTDWTANDVPVPKDFNRIEGNTLDNRKRLNGHDSDIANLNSRISANASEINKIKTRNVSVIMGTISNGNTLPLPSGFSESECFWIVSINSLETHIHEGLARASTRALCYVDG